MQVLRVGQQALTPSLDEAKWLRDLMQNPIYEDETRKEGLMRKVYFKAITEYIEHMEELENPKPKLPSPQCATCYKGQTGYDPDDDIPF